MDPNPNAHAMVAWVEVGFYEGITPRSQHCQGHDEGHPKVTARSNQIKTAKNSLFLLSLLQFCSLEMSMVGMAWRYTKTTQGGI